MSHATTRTAIGALLGTITVAAGSLTNGISVIDTGFSMVKTAADDAKRRQDTRSKLDGVTYQETILREKTMELEMQVETINAWIDQNPDRKERFNETYSRLQAALAPSST